jgi:hypothetical protein
VADGRDVGPRATKALGCQDDPAGFAERNVHGGRGGL